VADLRSSQDPGGSGGNSNCCTSRNDSRKLVEEFGGRTRIARNWLKRFADAEKEEAAQDWRAASDRQEQRAGACRSFKKPRLLVIPASARWNRENMQRRQCRSVSRTLDSGWKNSWSLADVGTGSGILALAAKRFGAGRWLAFMSIRKRFRSEATPALTKSIMSIFKLGDLRKWKSWPGGILLLRTFTASCWIEILLETKTAVTG